MANNTPEAVNEQNALLRLFLALRVGNFIVNLELLRFRRPPEHGLTVCFAEDLALSVGPVIDADENAADAKEDRCLAWAEAGRHFHRTSHVISVHRGHKDKTAPGLHESAVVFDDVDRAHVTNLPQKNLNR